MPGSSPSLPPHTPHPTLTPPAPVSTWLLTPSLRACAGVWLRAAPDELAQLSRSYLLGVLNAVFAKKGGAAPLLEVSRVVGG